MSFVIKETGIIDKERWEKTTPKICFIFNKETKIGETQIKRLGKPRIKDANLIPTIVTGIRNITETSLPDICVSTPEEQDEIVKDLAFIVAPYVDFFAENEEIEKNIKYISDSIKKLNPDIIIFKGAINIPVASPLNKERFEIVEKGYLIRDGKVILEGSYGGFAGEFYSICNRYYRAMQDLRTKGEQND